MNRAGIRLKGLLGRNQDRPREKVDMRGFATERLQP